MAFAPMRRSRREAVGNRNASAGPRPEKLIEGMDYLSENLLSPVTMRKRKPRADTGDTLKSIFPTIKKAKASEIDEFVRQIGIADDAVVLGKQVKGAWTSAEDEMLLAAVRECGPRHWRKIATRVPSRVAKQCRERWHNHLDPVIKKCEWTAEEDKTITNIFRATGSAWATIALSLPGRTDNAIKNRFHSVLKQKLGPGASRKTRVRRARKRLEFEEPATDNESIAGKRRSCAMPPAFFDDLENDKPIEPIRGFEELQEIKETVGLNFLGEFMSEMALQGRPGGVYFSTAKRPLSMHPGKHKAAVFERFSSVALSAACGDITSMLSQ